MVLLAGAVAAAEPEPAGYRMDAYRAPVPETLAGAEVIDSDRAHALWEAREAAFVDVLPQAPRPAGLSEGTVWHQPPRYSIPGATWLPNTGYGELAAPEMDYFRQGLAEVSGGDKAQPLVIFCRAECWMSWNAAKRALEEGYTQVIWYPDGTDGWIEAGYPTKKAEPAPGHP